MAARAFWSINLTVLTRDPTPYRSHFARLEIVCPGLGLAPRWPPGHSGSIGALRHAPLPDFFIGAHAAVSNLAVLTRDPTHYPSHFPRLALVCPG